jgi:hypothetical protein
MIVGFVEALVVLVILRVVYRQIYHYSKSCAQDVARHFEYVDMDEVFRLTNFFDEEQLRINLGEKKFRLAQLLNTRLLQEWVRCMARNADSLQEWASNLFKKRRYADEDEVKSCSRELIKACKDFRYGSRAVQLVLHESLLKMIVFPWRPAPMLSKVRKIEGFDLLHAYERIRTAAEDLGRACGDESLADIL